MAPKKKVAPKEYSIPVVITVAGYITVTAKSAEQAITEAREKYYADKQRLNYPTIVELPFVEVDFAYGDDETAVEEESE